MRLIDADALMCEFAEFVRESNNSDFADIPTWNDAVSLLGSAPTIDAVPAPEWIEFATREPDEEEREMHPDWEFVLDCCLPDDGERILVNVVHRGSEAVQMDEFYYDAESCYLGSGYEIGEEVTHWMPLPKPPKEGKI